MQLKSSDITLPKYSSSTSHIRQKKDYRDKKIVNFPGDLDQPPLCRENDIFLSLENFEVNFNLIVL